MQRRGKESWWTRGKRIEEREEERGGAERKESDAEQKVEGSCILITYFYPEVSCYCPLTDLSIFIIGKYLNFNVGIWRSGSLLSTRNTETALKRSFLRYITS